MNYKNRYYYPSGLCVVSLALMLFSTFGNKVFELSLPSPGLIWYWFFGLITTIFFRLWYTYVPSPQNPDRWINKIGNKIKSFLVRQLMKMRLFHFLVALAFGLISWGIFGFYLIIKYFGSRGAGPFLSWLAGGPVVAGAFFFIGLGIWHNIKQNKSNEHSLLGDRTLSHHIYQPR